MSSGSEKPAFLQIRVLCACFPMLLSCCPTLVLADSGVEILTGITGGGDTTQIILSKRYREKAGTLETRAVLCSFLCHFPPLCVL